MEQGTANCSDYVSHQQGVATARNTSASERDPAIRQSNLPQRTAVVLVPERGKYARTSGTYFDVEEGTLTGAVGIVAVLDQDTPVAVAEDKVIVAVGILTEVEDKRTVGADTSKWSIGAGRNLEEGVAILMGNPVHQDKTKSAGMLVRLGEVGCNHPCSGTDCRAMRVVPVA